MRIVIAGENTIIHLGRQGEENATEVMFDISQFREEFPGGDVKLQVELPGERIARDAEIQLSGEHVSWVVGPEWLAIAGSGRCQLTWKTEKHTAKSAVYTTKVKPALPTPTEML